jgi:hypothetical protein
LEVVAAIAALVDWIKHYEIQHQLWSDAISSPAKMKQ